MSVRLRAFGLEVDCRLALPGLPALDTTAPATLTVVASDAGELAAAWSGDHEPPRRVERWVDGRPLTIERGAAEDVRIRWGSGDGEFHIDPRARLLRAGARAELDARWRRVLLDSALGTAALVLGGHALHAGAVVIGGEVVAVTGPSGAGKTSLVAALLDHGHRLMCDDILALTGVDGAILGHPGPPVMNLPAGRHLTADMATIARLDDETWVAVHGMATEPAPLRALLLLERRAEDPLALDRIPAPAGAILTALLSPGLDRERQARHFELAAHLAAKVEILCLRSPLSADPSAIAGFVVDAIEAA